MNRYASRALVSAACLLFLWGAAACGQDPVLDAAIARVVRDDTSGLKRLDPEAWFSEYGGFLSREAFDEGAYGGDGIRIVSSVGPIEAEPVPAAAAAKAVWSVLDAGLFDTAQVMSAVRRAERVYLVRWTCRVTGEMAAGTYAARAETDTLSAILAFSKGGAHRAWVNQAPDHLSLPGARRHWSERLSDKPAPF